MILDGCLTAMCILAALASPISCEDHMPSDAKRDRNRTPVSTILTPLERSRVDAAAQGLCDALHRESLDEVLSDLRQQKAKLVMAFAHRGGGRF